MTQVATLPKALEMVNDSKNRYKSNEVTPKKNKIGIWIRSNGELQTVILDYMFFDEQYAKLRRMFPNSEMGYYVEKE